MVRKKVFKKSIESFDGQLIDRVPVRQIKQIPTTKEGVEKVIEEMITFCLNGECYDLAEFCAHKMFVPSRFYRLAEEFPNFNDALEICRMLIAIHLRKLWREDGYKQNYVLRFLPFYDKELRDDMAAQVNKLQGQNAILQKQVETFIIKETPQVSQKMEQRNV